MEFCNKGLIVCLIFVVLTFEKGCVLGDERDCPQPQCDPRSIICPYKTFFADIATRTICQGCNVCIKPGSPVDSEGCPQLPCPKSLPKGACFQPWIYNSWVNYHGKRCQTCEAHLCKM